MIMLLFEMSKVVECKSDVSIKNDSNQQKTKKKLIKESDKNSEKTIIISKTTTSEQFNKLIPNVQEYLDTTCKE